MKKCKVFAVECKVFAVDDGLAFEQAINDWFVRNPKIIIEDTKIYHAYSMLYYIIIYEQK